MIFGVSSCRVDITLSVDVVRVRFRLTKGQLGLWLPVCFGVASCRIDIKLSVDVVKVRVRSTK